MLEVQASELQTCLPRLLEEVERGRTVIITRDGNAIARLVPESEPERRQEEIDRAMQAIRELRKRTGKVTVEEIIAAKNEGRR
jgi:prevent-host-death family protein